jgi:alpha-L-arabinofuranosidase
MGRAVCEGVYEPEIRPTDASGFRTNMEDALGCLRMTIMRYPGGNFV